MRAGDVGVLANFRDCFKRGLKLLGQFSILSGTTNEDHYRRRDAQDRQFVAILRDITARKSSDAALAHSNGQRDRANATESRFLATMSHELRTPLNAIIGFSEMLTKKETLMINDERAHDYARLINETGRHLLSVVNGVLDVSKIESESFEIAPEAFAPIKAIEDCCNLLALKANEENLAIVKCMPGYLPTIVADKRSFNQILINLISNAIKFTSPGGTISVGARAEGGCVVVTVEDTGIGIGPEDLPRVGVPYFQARSTDDRRHEGAGLGLSIVKGLLALHGGDMKIDSQVGKGTRVTVNLPIDCERLRREEQPIVVCPLVRSVGVNSENRVKLSA